MHEDFETFDIKRDHIDSHIMFPYMSKFKFTHDDNDELYFIIDEDANMIFYFTADQAIDPLAECEDDYDAMEVIFKYWGNQGVKDFAEEFNHLASFNLMRHDHEVIHWADDYMTEETF